MHQLGLRALMLNISHVVAIEGNGSLVAMI